MPTNSSGKTFNGMYIDTIYIDNNSDTTMGNTDGYNDTTDGNMLNGATNNNTSISLTYGSKWIVEITNGSGSTFDFSTNGLQLNTCANYLNNSGGTDEIDTRYYLKSGTLSAGASIYFGFGNDSGTASGILSLASGQSNYTIATKSGDSFGTLDGLLIPALSSDQTTVLKYRLLPDQIISNNIYVTTRFRLFITGSGNDLLGTSAETENDDTGEISNFDNSFKRYLLFSTGVNNSGSSNNISSGYISRNPTVTGTSAPTTTYAESDWINRSSAVCQTPDYYLITHASVSDGTAKTYNGMYMDTVYIDNNSSTTMGNTDGYNDTTNNNLLNGATNQFSSISLTHGSRWILQITNGSGSSFDFSSNNLQLNTCANYLNNSGGTDEIDTRYYLKSGTLSNGASIYFGWGNDSGSASGILGLASGASNITLASNSGGSFGTLDGLLIPALSSDQSTVLKYRLLPDQIISNNIYVTTRFRLFITGSGNDLLGSSAETEDDDTGEISNFDNSFKRYVLFSTGNNNSGTSRNVSVGTINRDSSVTSTNAPTTTYAESDWEYKCTGSSSSSNFLLGTAVGDPHITTLSGENYKFDYLGAFRLFDNNEKLENRIIINGLSELGEGIKWKDNQYITKIFIFHRGNFAIIKTGNRGEKAKIETNNGLEIIENELNFDYKAKVYCHDCTRNINHNDFKKIYKHKIKNKHKIPYSVRNELLIRLKMTNEPDIIISISNVNEYNLQPCRIKILENSYISKNYNKFSGCIVDRKYSLTAPLRNIKSIRNIDEPTNNQLIKMPKLERRPELINIEFK